MVVVVLLFFRFSYSKEIVLQYFVMGGFVSSSVHPSAPTLPSGQSVVVQVALGSRADGIIYLFIYF